MAALQPLNGGKIIPIDRAVILVGRGQDCDAVITGSRKISRKHCCLVQADDCYLIRDLGSMNGVRVNGKRVEREVEMKSGDQVTIGDVEFLFNPNARGTGKRPADIGASPRTVVPVAVVDEAGDVDSDEVVDALEILDEDEVLDDIVVLEDDEEAFPRGSTPLSGSPLVRKNPLQSDPIINLDEHFADDDIDDIVTFGDD